MALLDISLVTKAIIKLVEEGVSMSEAWSGPGDKPTVSPLPPDRLSGNALGIYLYHVGEDAHYKNLPPQSTDLPPVRYTPMALNLYYQLCAHSASDNDKGHLDAQLLLGLAMKVLHDYPVLTDATEVNSKNIFEELGLDGADNKVRLTLQPVPYNEAGNLWSAGSNPVRLSSYYHASVILLEPEKTESRASRVLNYGVYPIISGMPRLTGSENTISFQLPGSSDTQEVTLRPAEAPIGGVIAFTGVDLTGDETQLLLQSRRWTEARQTDAAWNLKTTAGRLTVTVQDSISGETVLPDVYIATVRVVQRRTMPDGRMRSFEHSSNKTPFSIAPRIDNISTPNAQGVLTITGAVFAHADLAADSVQVYLSTERFKPNTGGSLAEGEFKINDALTIELRLPAGLLSGEFLPLRVLVNDVESPPRWIQVP